MNSDTVFDYEVIVVGAGISGLGAAYTMQKAGLKVCVLEKENRVGGRMSTDRVNGFVIDRGATILGRDFGYMRKLSAELNVKQFENPFRFVFGLKGRDKMRFIRPRRPDDLFQKGLLTFSSLRAIVRFFAGMLWLGRKLRHGQSVRTAAYDDQSIEEFLTRYGGHELLEKVLEPGLNGPMGGHFRQNSRLIVWQTFWNVLFHRVWAYRSGMDTLPEAMAKKLEVKLNCAVATIEHGHPCRITLQSGEVLTSKAVVVALPGNIAARVCRNLPAGVQELLAETTYGKMSIAHVMLGKRPAQDAPGMGFYPLAGEHCEIEAEHLRGPEFCPPGKAMLSLYFWDHAQETVSAMSDAQVNAKAREVIARHFPDCAEAIEGIHLVRWEEGIARFPPGRLKKMAALRQQMLHWDLPLQFCGDYLDGIATESALALGVGAGEVWVKRLRG
ncbi:MAG: FAD-dependent oxidoreductase [Bacteroidia bacterium]|jgi:oxygen-dependent protoporphyrinogen oxidase|nr:FAD-dependent oxidoreductase [Bacteroidia bacterium]